MELLFPFYSLVCGLVLRLLVWLVVALARLLFRFLRSMILDYPGLSALLLAMAKRSGWFTDPTVVQWLPAGIATLLLMSTVQFVHKHPPAELRSDLAHHVHEVQKYAAPVAAGVEWVRDRRREGRPPPPVPPPADVSPEPGYPPTPAVIHLGAAEVTA